MLRAPKSTHFETPKLQSNISGNFLISLNGELPIKRRNGIRKFGIEASPKPVPGAGSKIFCERSQDTAFQDIRIFWQNIQIYSKYLGKYSNILKISWQNIRISWTFNSNFRNIFWKISWLEHQPQKLSWKGGYSSVALRGAERAPRFTCFYWEIT